MASENQASMNETTELRPGMRVEFRGERRAYTVRAANERYAVCTKPFAPRRTVIYTIVDLERRIRGTEGLIFCMGFESDDDCLAALDRLASGESEVSRRNRVPLEIERIMNSAQS